MKLRSKVVEIEAILWDGSSKSISEIENFVGKENLSVDGSHPDALAVLRVWNKLEEQWINCPVGHYVLRGLKDEFYPCEPEALWMKYEVIDG